MPAAMLAPAARAQQPARSEPAAGLWSLLPDILCAAGALTLAGVGVMLLVGALNENRAGDFSLRRHAGGFGGSSTGWTLSPPLVRLLSGFALILLAAVLAMARVPLKEEPGTRADDRPGAVHGASSAAASSGSAASVASVPAAASSASAPHS